MPSNAFQRCNAWDNEQGSHLLQLVSAYRDGRFLHLIGMKHRENVLDCGSWGASTSMPAIRSDCGPMHSLTRLAALRERAYRMGASSRRAWIGVAEHLIPAYGAGLTLNSIAVGMSRW